MTVPPIMDERKILYRIVAVLPTPSYWAMMSATDSDKATSTVMATIHRSLCSLNG